MIYIDTSVLVAALTPEADTERAQKWLASHDGGTLCVSGWVVTEMSGALALKVRSRSLTIEQRADVLAHWQRMVLDNLTVLPVPSGAFDLAARFVDRHQLGLRAGDALHLAVASLGGHGLATFDKLLAKAAPQIGVPIERL